MITRQIEHVALLLLIAAVVAMLARKAHLPYTVGLLLTGFGLALLRSAPTFHLSKELIFSAFLSPLIFEAAFYLPWRELRRDLLYILFLASAGVLLAAGVTGVGMHYGAAWAWPTALLFGVLIAATDPVSVIATFKETRVPERLKIIVEAESLFNDGTAAVAFGVALAVVQGGDLTGAGIARAFFLTVLGGIACGAAVACTVLLLARKTDAGGGSPGYSRHAGEGGQNPLHRLLELFRVASDEVAGGLGKVWTHPLCGHQAYYSLIGRDYEWELMPLGLDQKVGAVVWSPLGWGRLGGKVRRGRPLPETSRLQNRLVVESGPPSENEYVYTVVDALDEVAAETGKTVAQVALNWLLQRPTVSTLVIGARNEEQLLQNLGAVGWDLTREQVGRLDGASATPRAYPYWHQDGFDRNPGPIG